jgi:hypothetical protein
MTQGRELELKRSNSPEFCLQLQQATRKSGLSPFTTPQLVILPLRASYKYEFAQRR